MARGRPREFDVDVVLDRALQVFWRQGYEATTIADLTDAMEINRPSLYAAFGDKEKLFRQAVERYSVGPAEFQRQLIEAAATARQAMESLLFNAVDAMTDPESPSGCLLVLGALGVREASTHIEAELANRRAETEQTVKLRLQRAVVEGDLPKHTDVEAMARYVATVFQGLAVQARAGATREQLRQVVGLAVEVIPINSRFASTDLASVVDRGNVSTIGKSRRKV